MKKESLKSIITASKVYIHKERYAYLKSTERSIKDHSLISKDADETTIITEEKNVPSTKHTESVRWFALIEVKISVPFAGKGLIATIAKSLADNGMNILVVSTFSKDYILVEYKKRRKAAMALRKLGFKVKQQ